MSPYRSNARPRLVVGDRVRVVLTRWQRLREDGGVSSWHGHTGEVRSLSRRDASTVAHLDLDVGCSIVLGVGFLARALGAVPEEICDDS